MQEIFPRVDIYSMYGLTECKRVCYLPPEQLSRKPESVGIPMPNTEAFVVDAQGRSLGPHEVGELVVRGSNVMLGYWNAPEETARIFRPGQHRRESLLYTGDLFRKDEAGFLYFVARKDDLIKSKGERISPKEVENILCAFDGVIEAAVIGVPDEVLGQAIKAFIVRDEKSPFGEKDVLVHCRKNLEPFAVPKYLEFRKTLPKSASGKIDKKRLARHE
jgi:acyl-CoA synthetase (AMP-forming)/AMP-acid ligase II